MDIVINVLSDFIFLGITLLLSWLFILLTHRGKLRKFFGADNAKQLIIYLSNLRVLTFGSIGHSGKKYSFQGSVVSFGEFEVANQIKEKFSFLIPDLNEMLHSLILNDIDVQVTISPLDEGKIIKENPIISLGSPAYNLVSKIIEDTPKNIVEFNEGKSSKKEISYSNPNIPPWGIGSDTDTQIYDFPNIAGGTADPFDPVHELQNRTTYENFSTSSKDSQEALRETTIKIKGFEQPFGSTTIGFIERIAKSKENDHTLFYIAGLSELATKGAAYYLLTNWRYLYKKYKNDKSFLIAVTINEQDYKTSSISFEKEIV